MRRGVAWIGAGIAALAAYGFVATLQEDAHFGRILAAYGGIFVAGSLAWGIIADGFRPDRYDLAGAAICLAGVAVIMFAPAPAEPFGQLPVGAVRAPGSLEKVGSIYRRYALTVGPDRRDGVPVPRLRLAFGMR